MTLTMFPLALTQFGFVLGQSFEFLLILRFVQGLFVPAIVTALLIYISQSKPESMSAIFSYYVAAQIFGGMAGRLLSGAIATGFGWRYSFVVLGLSLSINFVWLIILPRHQRIGSISIMSWKKRRPIQARSANI